MSTNHNGVGEKSCEVEKNCKRKFPKVLDKKVTSEIFRGFSKAPKILVKPIDIRRYQSISSNLILNDTYRYIEDFCKNENSIHKNRLLENCSVKVVNDDLNKLMQYVSRGSDRLQRVSSIDSTTSSTTDLNMSAKCNICEKEYPNEKKLLNHQENKHVIEYNPLNGKLPKRVSFSDHVIVHELKEYHRCRKCPKIFEEYKSLKKHMKQVHKKRKCYICYYCKKDFVDRTFFKVHIKLHCDICGLLLENKPALVGHRKYVCNILKLHKCESCNENYFKFMDLKDHSYDHIGTYFVCDICKDQFQTKCGVAHHIAFLHSKRKPRELYEVRNIGTEKLYLCKFCDESSVDRSLIEKHVELLPDLNNRVMTGYEDYYFCDHCLKKFDTEKNMLQHKWTHFLKVDKEPAKEIKRFFKLNEKLPVGMQPKVVIQQLKHPVLSTDENKSMQEGSADEDIIVVENKSMQEGSADKVIIVENKSMPEGSADEEIIVVSDVVVPKSKVNSHKALVDPVSKKTIISKFQCENCSKYFSNNYCLNRHIITQHSDFENLQCKVCEEVFAWPSLLMSHKCIRLNMPEMPFEDARPEIHFDNLHGITSNGLNIDSSDSYNVDFDIPEPIVQLSESTDSMNTPNFNECLNSNHIGAGLGTGNNMLSGALALPSMSVNNDRNYLKDILTQPPRRMNHKNIQNQFQNPACISGNLNSVNRPHALNSTAVNNVNLCPPSNSFFYSSNTYGDPVSNTFLPNRNSNVNNISATQLSTGTFINPVNGGNYKITVHEVPIEF